MSASPNDSLQLSERPLEKKLVSELLDIAKAMNIDTAKLHKPDILKAIKVHIQTHPGLADDPHLLPLVGHRTAPQALGKTSAGKATEEKIESSKPKEPATGANRALLEHNVKTDPPAQYKMLSPGGPKGDEIAEPADTEDVEGPLSEPDQEAEKGEEKHELSVFVDEFPVAVSTAVNGTKKYTTLLSDLLPAAIENDSPIKERGGRLYRPNIRDEPTAPHHIGKIDALLAKSSRALLARQMNEYNLVPLNDGSFSCDVFWEQSSIAGGVIPALRVELGPLGDTPGDQVVHTFRAKSTYCLQTVQWACGFPIGWGKCYRSESPPQVLAILDRIWLDHPESKPVSLRTMMLVVFFDTSSRKIPTVRGFARLNLWWMPGIISGTVRQIFCVAYGAFLVPPCNPAPTNGSQPDLIIVEEDVNGTKHQTRAFNTETAEQLNSWLNGFESELQWIPVEFSGAEDSMRRREPFKYTENRWDLLEFVEFSGEKAEKKSSNIRRNPVGGIEIPVSATGSQWKRGARQWQPPSANAVQCRWAGCYLRVYYWARGNTSKLDRIKEWPVAVRFSCQTQHGNYDGGLAHLPTPRIRSDVQNSNSASSCHP
ncbi:hypothetical protein B0H14DRAFT_3709260 [Mycena olivaceomarginata]|nr:hypothetical protein B0H14DRAFT_3709260 [Mycena olivaceomarginata]